MVIGHKVTKVVLVDYQDKYQLQELIGLLNAYALDPMGGGQALTTQVQDRLIVDLPQQNQMCSLVVRVDGDAAGFCNCLWGYSTFAARPLLNIHDLAILPKFRGLSLSQNLLRNVATIARRKQAVKMTLEVLNNNYAAMAAYRRFGFQPYALVNGDGKAEFWQYYLN